MPSKRTSVTLDSEDRKSGGYRTGLPVRRPLKLAYIFSLLIAVLTAIASLTGIINPEEFYPTADLKESAVPNDIVTLFIGLPILLGSMWLARRGSLLGLLLWPGAIFYGLYNYFIYLFGMPLTVLTFVYLAIVTASIYTLIGITSIIEGDPVKSKLEDRVSERFSGAVLIALGVLFTLLAISSLLNGVTTDALVTRHEMGLASADILISAAWIIAGIMLWRRQALGYVSGTGLYFQGSMLFIGLILLLLLQPLLTDSDLLITDIVVTAILSIICFFPFGLFVRGLIQSA